MTTSVVWPDGAPEVLPPLLSPDQGIIVEHPLLPGYRYAKAWQEDYSTGEIVRVGEGLLNQATMIEARRRTVNAAVDFVVESWNTECPVTDVFEALKGGMKLTDEFFIELCQRDGGVDIAKRINRRSSHKLNNKGQVQAEYEAAGNAVENRTRYITTNESPIEGRAIMIDDMIDFAGALKGMKALVEDLGHGAGEGTSPLTCFSVLMKEEVPFFEKPHAWTLLTEAGFKTQNIWEYQSPEDFEQDSDVFVALTSEGAWIDMGDGLASDHMKPFKEAADGLGFDPEQPFSSENKPSITMLLQMEEDERHTFVDAYSEVDAKEREVSACVTGPIQDHFSYLAMIDQMIRNQQESERDSDIKIQIYRDRLATLKRMLQLQLSIELRQAAGVFEQDEEIEQSVRNVVIPFAEAHHQRLMRAIAA